MQTRQLVAMVFVADVGRSVEFYGLLGFEVGNTFTQEGATGPTWAWLQCGEAQLMLAAADEPIVAEQQRILFYLYTDDVASAHAELAEALEGLTAEVSLVLVLALIVGGIAVMGVNGFVIGPVIAALFIALWSPAALFAGPAVTLSDNTATNLLIEAMKTFNQIKAPKAGTVARVLVSNAAPVEYGEVLMILD